MIKLYKRTYSKILTKMQHEKRALCKTKKVRCFTQSAYAETDCYICKIHENHPTTENLPPGY